MQGSRRKPGTTDPIVARAVKVVDGASIRDVTAASLIAGNEPVVFRRAVENWPLVAAGRTSRSSAMAYIKAFDRGQPLLVYRGAPRIRGRFFYNEDLSGLNFSTEWISLDAFFDHIEANADHDNPASFYIGSLDMESHIPGLVAGHGWPIADFGSLAPLCSIWLGNRTVAAAHFDMSHNIACCAVGRRRFTLFPPEQVHNLYPGPLEPTPGGQPVSMVDLSDPDLDRYPRFAHAMQYAQIAEMEPGDLLFYPALWWHQVEALDSFNALVNFWWNSTPAFVDSPMNTLLHALLSLRDRPDNEKLAWKAMFEYYVFGPSDRAQSHLPESARGDLCQMNETRARRLRSRLLQRLNR